MRFSARDWHERHHRVHRHGRHLRHRIFFSLGAAIVLSVTIAGIVVHSASSNRFDPGAFRSFANERFAAVWNEPEEREELIRSIERHFNVEVTLREPSGKLLRSSGRPCTHTVHRLTVAQDGKTLGTVEACSADVTWPKNVILGLGSLVLVLWAISGILARSLVRPLDELVRVVRAIGDGKLDARVQLQCRHDHGEVGEVAQAVNLMAEKIEHQIEGQRELLAGVSHEIRSPLARLRVLVELERDVQGSSGRLDSMDAELSELDSLVGQLLAQSRLEFQSLDKKTLLAVEVAKTALERASLSPSQLHDFSNGAHVNVDASLFVRALMNLLENAKVHGRSLEGLTVRTASKHVIFEIADCGSGLDESELNRVFEPFVGDGKRSGLGLGLALVRRIIVAHGGRVWLANRAENGAVATIELPRVEVP